MKSCEIYHQKYDSWSNTNPMAEARYGAAGCFDGIKSIYVAGQF